MIMPCERTRALRWAGKFLEKLNGVELPKNIKREISHILRRYPSVLSLSNEVKFQSLIAAQPEKGQRHEPWLGPEEPT